jgi:hypothetical protein
VIRAHALMVVWFKNRGNLILKYQRMGIFGSVSKNSTQLLANL